MRCVLLGVPLLEGAPWFPALLCPPLQPKGTDPATLSSGVGEVLGVVLGEGQDLEPDSGRCWGGSAGELRGPR